ncbi:MAG: toxic anion resistance protein, partial [Janthinobacterium lividum]
MPIEEVQTPLDLSLFGDLTPIAPETPPAVAAPTVVTDPRLISEPPQPRLVDVSTLAAGELAAAEQDARRIDFRNTTALLSHGDGVLAEIAQSSRQLLSGVRLGDAGEIGGMAAAVLDGIKILRIQDLQAEASHGPADRPKGLVGRFLRSVSEVQSAFAGFAESRKTFLDLMDQEQAKARRTKADLAVAIDLLDQQAKAIRTSLYGLKIAIAAGQIALDRGQDELEALRQHAVVTGDP